MSGLMYPKVPAKKKRKKHKVSILQAHDGTCYLCRRLHDDCRIHAYLERHHVFGGADRDKSEAEGLTVYLCVAHHREGPEAAHLNQYINRILQQDAQMVYEAQHSHEEFMELIGKNFI